MNDDDLLRADIALMARHQAELLAGSHCALCGREYDGRAEGDDLRYVGGMAGESRSVHAACWEGFTGLCERLGLDWRTAVEQEFAARRARYGQASPLIESGAYIDTSGESGLHKRRAALVDKKFGAGLTSAEETELANIDRRLNELEAPFYNDLMARLPEVVEEFWGLGEEGDA